jgi:hemerythrin-like domain-containing protein
MRLLDVLAGEHRGVSAMLGVLDAVATRVRGGGEAPLDMIDGLVDYFDRCAEGHHAQEERLLFPLLEQHGLGRDETVINALLAQHDAHRAYTRRMRAGAVRVRAGEVGARESFAADARSYTELIREHIRIEDHYFYGVAAEVLTRAEQEQIIEAFGHPMGRDLPEQDRRRFLQMMTDYPRIVQEW